MDPVKRIEQALAAAIEQSLIAAVAHAEAPGCPPRLAAAVRHAVFPGGERIRPSFASPWRGLRRDPPVTDAAASPSS